MSHPADFAHPLLRVPTPVSWIAAACASRDVLLIDHANCEKKAASTALSLMFAYAEDLELTDKMSRLAREELRHYEQVAKLIRSLGLTPQRLAPGRYAERLRRLVAKSEPQREIDLMICGAFIEARSCERFAQLADAIGAPLGDLFRACTMPKPGTTGFTWTLRAVLRKGRAWSWRRELPSLRRSSPS